MRFLRPRGFRIKDYLVLLFFLCQGFSTSPNESHKKLANQYTVNSQTKVDPIPHLHRPKDLEDKSKTPEGTHHEETHLVERGLFDSFLGISPTTEKPKHEDHEHDHGSSAGGWFNFRSPKSKTGPTPENLRTREEKSADSSGGGWLNLWSPESKTPATPPENLRTRDEKSADSSGGGWLNLWSPKSKTHPAPPENLGTRDNEPADNSEGGWWGGWSIPSTPAPEPPKPPKPEEKSGGVLSGWFSSPAEDKAGGKKEKKHHGRVREFVKSVEHIFPKTVRRSVKSIPGVRSTHRAMKSGLDVVDSAVDTVANTDYLRNIGEASKKSSKRVSLKAVSLADSVWTLGTGTSEAALNMADTLQKESARTLDSVGMAITPAKQAVDYVNTNIATGVANLQGQNERLKKGGKSMLSQISSFANLDEVANEKDMKVTPPEPEKKPESTSWW